MIKTAFKAIACFWIVSPAMFFAARFYGPYNYTYDTLIMLFFCLMSWVTMFLTYGRWGENTKHPGFFEDIKESLDETKRGK